MCSGRNDSVECPGFPRLLGLVLGVGQLAQLEQEMAMTSVCAGQGGEQRFGDSGRMHWTNAAQRKVFISYISFHTFGSSLPHLQGWLDPILAIYKLYELGLYRAAKNRKLQ